MTELLLDKVTKNLCCYRRSIVLQLCFCLSWCCYTIDKSHFAESKDRLTLFNLRSVCIFSLRLPIHFPGVKKESLVNNQELLLLVIIFFNIMTLTLQLPDQICNSPYCQPYNSYNVSSENLVLDQLIIPKLIFFLILITYLVDIVLIL